jgi:hypothetical protein
MLPLNLLGTGVSGCLCLSRSLKVCKGATLKAHLSEYATLFADEGERSVKLSHDTLVENNQAVVVNHLCEWREHACQRIASSSSYRFQAMRHSEQERITKFLADGRLYLRIRCEVNAARRLVEDDDRSSAEESTSKRQQLPLALREVRASGRNVAVERDSHSAVLGHGTR